MVHGPYSAADLPLFLALPILVALSAFFSGSETALFSLSARQRLRLQSGHGILSLALRQLLADLRMLLITLMFGNMTVNVLYFIITSVLLLKLREARVNSLVIAAASLGPLLVLIMFGELLPKLLANRLAAPWARLASPPLWIIHRAIAPARLLLGHAVIEPLARLIAPAGRPASLSPQELEALLEMSQQRGVIDEHEEDMLREVVNLAQLKVRDVMTPRVDIKAIEVGAAPAELHQLIARTHRTKFPVFQATIDDVIGVIHAKEFLLAHRGGRLETLRPLVRQVRFVPELQRADRLIQDLRKYAVPVAVVVDEYGGTAGMVTLKGVIRHVLGELHGPGGHSGGQESQVRPCGYCTFRVSGRLNINDWTSVFGREQVPPRVSTVNGLLMAKLNRVPAVGDVVKLGNLTVEVEQMDGPRVAWAKLYLDSPMPEAPA